MRGGGVGLWYRASDTDIQHLESLSYFEEGGLECLTVELISSKRVVCVFYNPPQADPDALVNKLQTIFKYASETGQKAFFVSDCNIDWLKKSTSKTNLQQLLANFNATQVVSSVTRPSSRTLLDHIYISNHDKSQDNFFCNVGNNIFISDHSPVFL